MSPSCNTLSDIRVPPLFNRRKHLRQKMDVLPLRRIHKYKIKRLVLVVGRTSAASPVRSVIYGFFPCALKIFTRDRNPLFIIFNRDDLTRHPDYILP